MQQVPLRLPSYRDTAGNTHSQATIETRLLSKLHTIAVSLYVTPSLTCAL